MKSNKIKNKQYILQGNDNYCQLITLLNFLIHKTGESPIKYHSKEFTKIVRKCKGFMGTINPDSLLKELNLKFQYSPKFTSIVRFKKWVIYQLKNGHCIDFTFYHPRYNLHSVLLINYNKKCGGFKVINAQLYTDKDAVEYLSWDELTKECYNDNPKIYPYFNKKEGTGAIMGLVIKGKRKIDY